MIYLLVLDIVVVFREILELYFMGRRVVGTTCYKLGVCFRYIKHNIMVLMVKQCYEIVVKDTEKFSSVEQLIISINILMTMIVKSCSINCV